MMVMAVPQHVIIVRTIIIRMIAIITHIIAMIIIIVTITILIINTTMIIIKLTFSHRIIILIVMNNTTIKTMFIIITCMHLLPASVASMAASRRTGLVMLQKIQVVNLQRHNWMVRLFTGSSRGDTGLIDGCLKLTG